MQADAVLLEKPERIALSRLTLDMPTSDDIVVQVDWSGISTGTERLLWSGRMPPFPGMGYPLVPGYEAVGRVLQAGPGSEHAVGDAVFVPGASCFGEIRGLFGASASRLVIPSARAIALAGPLAGTNGAAPNPDGILLALAATAQHAVVAGSCQPDLIVGHGVLGRLLARLAVAAGGQPTVWERNPLRADGAVGYAVVDPDADPRKDYRCIVDCSGDPALLDALIGRLARNGELVLAGFYADRLSFSFPPAFMREVTLRIAAQWQPADLLTVRDMAQRGALSLAGLISDVRPAAEAPDAYRTAFENVSCTKMILDWSAHA